MLAEQSLAVHDRKDEFSFVIAKPVIIYWKLVVMSEMSPRNYIFLTATYFHSSYSLSIMAFQGPSSTTCEFHLDNHARSLRMAAMSLASTAPAPHHEEKKQLDHNIHNHPGYCNIPTNLSRAQLLSARSRGFTSLSPSL